MGSGCDVMDGEIGCEEEKVASWGETNSHVYKHTARG